MSDISELDLWPGNLNGNLDRSTGRLWKRESVFFSHYTDAPHIVAWLKAHNIEAGYEQRKNEGVTVYFDGIRAYVGDSIIIQKSGSARVYTVKN